MAGDSFGVAGCRMISDALRTNSALTDLNLESENWIANERNLCVFQHCLLLFLKATISEVKVVG